MKSRIEILKEIMEIEKQFALEEIDSEAFESQMHQYPKIQKYVRFSTL